MNETFFFTIIIPHYNIPKLLQRCLDSIPDNEDIQVIVVDNNSSPEKVDFEHFPGLERKYTQVIFDKEGRGAGHARNIALPFVKSKWVLFSDSDDFMQQGFYQELLKYKDSDADIVVFKANSVDSETLIPTRRDEALNLNIDRCLKGEVSTTYVAMNHGAPWCKLISTELIRKHNIVFQEVMRANDVLFSTKIACFAKKILVSTVAIYTITSRPGSLAFSAQTDFMNLSDRVDVFIGRNQFLKKNGFKPSSLIPNILAARKISIKSAFIIAFRLMKSGTFFDGLEEYLRKFLINRIYHR